MDVPIKLKARIVDDDTGTYAHVPVILTDGGVLKPLLDYLLAHQHNRSLSWMERIAYATYLLLQYL